jgi:hypothetical protein
LHPELADAIDRAICQQLLSMSVLTVLFESLAVIFPQEDGPKKYDLEMVQYADDAPPAELQKCKDRIQEGVLQEANQAAYFLI